MRDEFISKWESQVKKGVLEFIILLLLDGEELYGYELISKLKASTDYDVAEGTIYPLLNRLKTDGLINYYWQDMGSGIPRKYYALTKEGQMLLAEMKSYWNVLGATVKQLSK